LHTCDNPALGKNIQHLGNTKLYKSSEFGENIPKIQRVQEICSSLSCMIQRGAKKSSEPNTQNPASDPESYYMCGPMA
jgi:hypothetical protein